MAKASSSARAPRGTKILAKAFFTAADEIPEPQRADVVKAALALIRDELKATREKAAAAKAKAKAKTGSGKAPASSGNASTVAMKPVPAGKKAASAPAKSPAKRARRAAPPAAEPPVQEGSDETPVVPDT